MNEFAAVAPLRLLQEMWNVGGPKLFGNYHLVLAHDVLANPYGYESLFEKVRHVLPEVFVILDNSLIELGSAMDTNALGRAANYVNANTIVLPDVLGAFQDTMELSSVAAEKLSDYGFDSFMGVVQGQDYGEYMMCASRLRKLPGVKYLAIPRILANKQRTRMRLLRDIVNAYRAFEEPFIHLLGMSQFPADDINCARHPMVMGIDSANPLVLGYRGQEWPDGGHVGRGRYWKQVMLNTQIESNIRKIISALET